MIQEYFNQRPSTRAQRRQEYASCITTDADVFTVLELGSNKDTLDGYDGAVDILAECNANMLSIAIESAKKKYDFDSWEDKWEILINALSCANIDSEQKQKILIDLSDRTSNKLITLTIKDALSELPVSQDEIYDLIDKWHDNENISEKIRYVLGRIFYVG